MEKGGQFKKHKMLVMISVWVVWDLSFLWVTAIRTPVCSNIKQGAC